MTIAEASDGIRQAIDVQQTQKFAIEGVRCGSCIAKIEKMLLDVPGISIALIEDDRRTLAVTHELTAPLQTINDRLGSVGGYRIRPRGLISDVRTNILHYRPLITISLLVVLIALCLQPLRDGDSSRIMADLMAVYFLVFGSLKVVNHRAFADAYAGYDWLAVRSHFYAGAYPFLEVSLGLAYLISPHAFVLNLVVALLMLEKAWSVHRALGKGNIKQCACLGGFFSIPISKVTVFEDLLMAAMATIMLVS